MTKQVPLRMLTAKEKGRHRICKKRANPGMKEMMKKVFAVFVVMITLLLFVKAVLAGGPNIKPGKWEFKTTATMPMMTEAKVTTETDCITAEEVERDPLAAMIEEARCNVLNRKVSSNTIEFELECDGDMGMKMSGRGYFTADGATASGKMEMTMNIPQMGGQSMNMIQEWEGKRIGDCE